MLRTQKSVKPLDVCWAFSRGEISSSSDELPVYEAEINTRGNYMMRYKHVTYKENKEQKKASQHAIVKIAATVMLL